MHNNWEGVESKALKKCGTFLQKCGTLLYKSVAHWNMCHSVAQKCGTYMDIIIISWASEREKISIV